MKTSTALYIRAAQPSDVDALTELANLPGVRYGTMRLPYTPRALFERRLAAGSGSHLLVGEIEEGKDKTKVVTYGALMPRSGRMAHVGDVMLFVHDECTGQGFGSAIFEALLDLADNWLGLRRLELDVNVDNAAAIHLYERHGFEIEGTKRGDILRAGELVDTHVMGRLHAAPKRASI